jgi:hypothetical protein
MHAPVRGGHREAGGHPGLGIRDPGLGNQEDCLPGSRIPDPELRIPGIATNGTLRWQAARLTDSFGSATPTSGFSKGWLIEGSCPPLRVALLDERHAPGRSR